MSSALSSRRTWQTKRFITSSLRDTTRLPTRARSPYFEYVSQTVDFRKTTLWQRTQQVGFVSLDTMEVLHFDQSHPQAQLFALSGVRHLANEAHQALSADKRETRRGRANNYCTPAKAKKRKAPPGSLVTPAAASMAATIGDGVDVGSSTLGEEAGLGLFAKKAFSSGQIITMYDGVELPGGQREACNSSTRRTSPPRDRFTTTATSSRGSAARAGGSSCLAAAAALSPTMMRSMPTPRSTCARSRATPTTSSS